MTDGLYITSLIFYCIKIFLKIKLIIIYGEIFFNSLIKNENKCIINNIK